MKDRVFTGQDVAAAVAEAGRVLGVGPKDLRYVVLEPGKPGGMGIGGTPARIAVLLDAPEGQHAGGVGGPEEDEAGRQPHTLGPLDPRAAMRAAMRSLADAAGIDVSMEIEDGPEGTIVQVGGPDREFFFEEDGEVLKALEHLFQRIAARAEGPRLRVACEGYRERRDAALADYARKLAAEVRRTGRSRVTDPLNSYERRVIHMALTGADGVRTFSVGEGLDRRVTIAPREADDEEGEAGPRG
jgi:spoIIIJ-associated protein